MSHLSILNDKLAKLCEIQKSEGPFVSSVTFCENPK